MPKLFLLVGLALALLGGGIRAQAPSATEQGRPFVQAWAPKDYGAHPTNWAVVQGQDGLIYVGNGTHVLVYDGVRWDRFEVAPQGTIRALAPAPDGGLFVGSIGDFGHLGSASDGTLEYTSFLDRLPESDRVFSNVWEVIPTQAGTYFQTSDRLFRLDTDDTITTFARRASDAYGTLFALHDRLVIRDRTQGLAWVEDTTLVAIAGSERFREASLYGVVPRGERTVLLSVDEGLLDCDLRPDAPLTCASLNASTNALLVPAWPYRVQPLEDGRWAVATITNGVALLAADGTFEQWLTQDDGLPSDAVTALALDANGGLWMATQNGIARAEVAAPLSQFDGRDGLDGTPVHFARHDGVLYVSTVEGVFALRPGAGSTRPRFEAVLDAPDQCWQFAVHPGALYVGCNRTVHRLEGGTPAGARFVPKRWFDVPEGFAFALAPSHHAAEVVFVGSDTGVLRARLDAAGNAVTTLLAEDSASSLYEEPALRGDTLTLWAGSWKGLRRLRLHRATGDLFDVTSFGPEAGLPEGDVAVRALGGALAVGTQAGLFVTDPAQVAFRPHPRFGTIRNAEGDTLAAVSFVEDARGHVWLPSGADSRLLRPEPDGSAVAITEPFRRLATVNGFALHVDADGTAWLGSDEGLFRFDAGAFVAPQEVPAPFATHIRQVRVATSDSLVYGGYGPEGLAAVALAHTAGHLDIEVGASQFDAPDRLAFRFRLDPLDDAWSPWTARPFRTITNLPGGSYTLHAQARDLYGRLGVPASLTVTVASPWYQTPWARVAGGLLFLGLIVTSTVLLSRYQTRRLSMRAALLAQRVEARTEVIREKNAALEATNAALSTANLDLLHLNHTLEGRTVELREALERNKEFLGIAAHDLKNPLSGIAGLADVLIDMREGMDASEQNEVLGLIRGEALRAVALITDLLDDAQRKDEDAALRLANANLAEIAQAVVRWNQAQAERKQITLHADRLPRLNARVDAAAVQRAMDNLVSNAVKYSPPGSRVWLTLAMEPGTENGSPEPTAWARFAVRDEGPGLTADDRARAFGKLTRLSAQPTGGEHASGLGLYIAKQIAEAHGGTAGVESEHGQGATFWLRLPLEPAPTPEELRRA